MSENQISMEEVEVKKDVQRNPFDDIGGDYVKLEQNVAKILVLADWNIQTIEKFKDEKTGNLKKQPEFSAVVLKENGIGVVKTFTTTSFNAMKGLKEVFGKYWPDTKTPRTIRIKKIGEGKATIYDIEEVQK